LKALANKGAISKYAILDKVPLVDELAKTSVVKFDKKRLRHKYGDR
jgi:non-ribosomal peptide synthetase component E (peptide arylation enzyme)